jgi:hypothetical protein
LEQGQWKFALRTSKLTYSTDVIPTFGYSKAFERPIDCVKLAKVCSDEYLKTPLLNYTEEAGWWFADLDEIYVSYVSDDADFGLDYANWPETFSTFVATYLAAQSGLRINQSERTVEKLEKELTKVKRDALSKDAMQGPTQFLPAGLWTSARHGRRGSRTDRGSRSNLIG